MQCLGYYKNVEETQKVFNAEGWLLTGDIGSFRQMDFQITDRKRTIQTSSGGKIHLPFSIEKNKESIYIDQSGIW